MEKENKQKQFPLSYESDGVMNEKGNNRKNKELDNEMFFNTTQDSE